MLGARLNLVNRLAARLARQQPPSFLKKLLERASLVPSPESDDGAEIGSTAALDRALEDRLLSEREGDELVHLALHWGLSVETVHRLHEAYLRHLVAVALADGMVPPTEQRDLQQVARLLGIGEARLEEIVTAARTRLGTMTTAVVSAPAEAPVGGEGHDVGQRASRGSLWRAVDGSDGALSFGCRRFGVPGYDCFPLQMQRRLGRSLALPRRWFVVPACTGFGWMPSRADTEVRPPATLWVGLADGLGQM